jgi:hypothetical protein
MIETGEDNMGKKKIKIRIAVVVDDRGNWGCAGASGMSARDALDLALDGVESGYYRVYWLNVEVDAPRPIEVYINNLPPEAIEEDNTQGV